MKLKHLLKGVFLELHAEQSYHQKFPVRIIEIEAKCIHLLSFDSGSVLKFPIHTDKDGSVSIAGFDSYKILPFNEGVHVARLRVLETEKRMEWFRGTDKFSILQEFHQDQNRNIHLMTEPWEQLEESNALVA